MTKKEIRKRADAKIKAGYSRQEAIRELKAESKINILEAAKIMRFIPTAEQRKKFAGIQITLLVLLGIKIIFRILMGLVLVLQNGAHWTPFIFLLPVFYVLMIYGVATYRADYYRLIGILTVIGLLRGLSNQIDEGFDVYFIIDIVFAIALICLSIFMHFKMTTTYQIVKEKHIDPQGKERLKSRIVFDE